MFLLDCNMFVEYMYACGFGGGRPLRSRTVPGSPKNMGPPFLVSWTHTFPMTSRDSYGNGMGGWVPQVMQVPENFWCNIGSRIPTGPPNHPTQTISCERIMKQKHWGLVVGPGSIPMRFWPDVFFWRFFKNGWFLLQEQWSFCQKLSDKILMSLSWRPGHMMPGSSRLPLFPYIRG